MSNTYPFRTDDGEIIQVEWLEMMDADNGVLIIDGVRATRARDLEAAAVKAEVVKLRTDCISDSLGFAQVALEDQQAHLKRTGIRGIEFKEDPDVKGFVQVHCTTQEAKLKYAASRGLHDRNSDNGGAATLGEAGLQAAIELVSRKRQSSSIGSKHDH